MRRADRLLQLLQILRRHRRPVTGETIAGELEVSLRTVYRDIAALIGQRVPVRGEAGIGYVLDDGFDMPPLMFTVDELEAVMLGLRWVGRRGDGQLSRAARDSVAKIGAVLPAGLKPYLFDASLIVPPRFASIEPAMRSMWHAAQRHPRGAQGRHPLCRSCPTPRPDRTIWPIALAYYEAKRLLVAWCEMREAFRISAPTASPKPMSWPSAIPSAARCCSSSGRWRSRWSTRSITSTSWIRRSAARAAAHGPHRHRRRPAFLRCARVPKQKAPARSDRVCARPSSTRAARRSGVSSGEDRDGGLRDDRPASTSWRMKCTRAAMDLDAVGKRPLMRVEPGIEREAARDGC